MSVVIDQKDGHHDIRHSTDAPSADPGEDGANSSKLTCDDQNLKFKAANTGTWTVQATSGAGGTGGVGNGSPPVGSTGGTGGISGAAHAIFDNRTVATTTSAHGGVTIGVSATTGSGGHGGLGEFPMSLESSGNGGTGGIAGAATALIDNNHFAVANSLMLELSASGGTGGAGGAPGPSGGPGESGMPGNGGKGGDASATIDANTIAMSAGKGHATTLTVLMLALGGDGGAGAAGGEPGEEGFNGNGGNGSAAFTHNIITGGGENDVVQLLLGAAGGDASNPLGEIGIDGSAALDFSGNTFNGGGGVDTFAFSASGIETTFAVTVNLSAGIATVHAPNGDSSSTLTNYENVTGGAGDDVLVGNTAHNTLDGSSGNDTIRSSHGGGDTFTGGLGNDTFVFHAAGDSPGKHFDTITDLEDADTIDISHVAHGATKVDAFDHHAKEYTLIYDGHRTVLSVDVNGDGRADMVVHITGDHHDFTNIVT